MNQFPPEGRKPVYSASAWPKYSIFGCGGANNHKTNRSIQCCFYGIDHYRYVVCTKIWYSNYIKLTFSTFCFPISTYYSNKSWYYVASTKRINLDTCTYICTCSMRSQRDKISNSWFKKCPESQAEKFLLRCRNCCIWYWYFFCSWRPITRLHITSSIL